MYTSMNTPQFQESSQFKSELPSHQLLKGIKIRPVSQLINGVEYTYSILCKKRQTFLFGNDRFLYLKGIDSISYAREFPQNQRLPFTHVAEIPIAKATFPLAEIEHFTNDQERFIIQFSGDKRVKWEFVCPSKVCALEWRKKLDQAMKTLNEFNLSGFQRYDDYVRNKEMQERERFNQQESELNNILASRVNYTFVNEPVAANSNDLHNSRSQLGSTNSSQLQLQTHSTLQTQHQFQNQQQIAQLIVSQQPISNLSMNQQRNQDNFITIQHEQPPREEPHDLQANEHDQLQHPNQELPHKLEQLGSSKRLLSSKSQKFRSHHDESAKSSTNLKEVPRPTAVQYRGESITKVDHFIIDTPPEEELFDRSMKDISFSEKVDLKNEIAKLRRNWVEQIISGEEVSLVIDFKNYVQRVAEVVVNQLFIDQQEKIFPVSEETKDHAAYLIDDVLIELYFYSEDHLISKNPRYKNSVLEFKNFDYLLGVTQNQGILKVPLMVLFEYKGFLGMGRTRIESSGHYCNREVYEVMNHKEFEEDTRVKADVLLNQSKCKIVSYSKQAHSIGLNLGGKTYFVEKLTEFLPTEQEKHKLFRPEFMQDQELDDTLFRGPANEDNARISDLFTRKIDELISMLESEKEYFTNSRQLAELIHCCGLNMRHIGIIYKRARQDWLKKILRADIIARCLKNYFRYDIQNLARGSMDKQLKRQRQQQRETKRVISFLNIIFGNTETTFRIWRNLNSYAQQIFHVKVWENEFTDIHVPYLLLAIQCHLKIVLGNEIHSRKVFKNMESFQARDFIRFQFDATIYNLDFTEIFEGIHECLEEQTFDSFHCLCEVLTKEANKKMTYFQLLRSHPINDLIREFLLEFTAPQDNYELYSRIEERSHPSRLMYESKLAEIRWYLKAEKHENINKIANFIQDHVKRWFGDVHPLYTHLNRLLAEEYSELDLQYAKALKYANASLDMQQAIFGGNCEQIWKDYFLIGKIHFLNAKPHQSLKYLMIAKQLVRVENLLEYEVFSELCLMLSKCYFGLKYFKQSYNIVKQLYRLIRNSRDESSLAFIIESVALIKQLLEINQEHESYERFIESDFSQIAAAFAEYPSLMNSSIKMIAIPSLKTVLLRNSKIRPKLLKIIDEISKITQSSSTCLAYLKAKITEGAFPKNYLQCLKEIDAVIEEIEANQMIERWQSFNKMTNQSILDKISGSISRGFEFLANLTALFNLLGPQALGELFIMEK